MRVDTQDIGGECLDVNETESVTDNSGDGTDLLYTYAVLRYRIAGRVLLNRHGHGLL